MSDIQLLRAYAENRSEAAFGEIVARHTDLVYSAALRQTGSPDLAGDVAQSVFVDLAGKASSVAGKFSETSSLAGWLYRSTRYAALNQSREERRRLTRERQAMENMDTTSVTAPDWNQVRPLLDEAMTDLSDEDRDVLLLRFFKNQDFRAVGLALSISDDTAQKRAARALEKLQAFLKRRGVTTSATMLSSVLSLNTIQTAPVGLASSISTAATLAGTHLTTGAVAAKTIAMTTLQKTLVTVALVAAAGTAVYETRQAASLADEMRTLQKEHVALVQEANQSRRADANANEQLSVLQQENERLRQAAADVPRLRGEIARLREQNSQLLQAKAVSNPQATDSSDPFIQSVLAMASQAIELKQLAEQMPDKKIPEMAYLSPNDWLEAAKTITLDPKTDPREAMKKLRTLAKQKLFPRWMQALRSYAYGNEGLLPSDVSALKPYFDSPVSDEVLQRYQMIRSGKLVDYDWFQSGKPMPKNMEEGFVISERAPTDPEYNDLYEMGIGNSAHTDGSPRRGRTNAN